MLYNAYRIIFTYNYLTKERIIVLESLKDSLGVWWEILLLIAGAMLPPLFGNTKKYLIYQNRKKAIRKFASSTDLNIDTIQSSDPEYKESEFCLELTNHSYYLAFPPEKVSLINQQYDNFNFNKEQYFSNEEPTVEKLSELFPTELRNHVIPLIEKHREAVADDFINKENGCLFNSNKLGVYKIREVHGIGHDEQNAIKILLYHTDYFTHRVMKAVYKELVSNNIYFDLSSQYDSKKITQLRPFMTSIGVNIILITDVEHDKHVVLSQRSHRSAHGENADKFNSTVMEGITLIDCTTKQNRIYISNVIDRALTEEIGIQYPVQNKKVYDVFLEKNYFEVGITAAVELEETFEERVKHLPSKDGALEIKQLVSVPMSQQKLNDFVAAHEFMQQGLYTLKMIAARHDTIIRK